VTKGFLYTPFSLLLMLSSEPASWRHWWAGRTRESLVHTGFPHVRASGDQLSKGCNLPFVRMGHFHEKNQGYIHDPSNTATSLKTSWQAPEGVYPSWERQESSCGYIWAAEDFSSRHWTCRVLSAFSQGVLAISAILIGMVLSWVLKEGKAFSRREL
jgi:hypothetical protein